MSKATNANTAPLPAPSAAAIDRTWRDRLASETMDSGHPVSGPNLNVYRLIIPVFEERTPVVNWFANRPSNVEQPRRAHICIPFRPNSQTPDVPPSSSPCTSFNNVSNAAARGGPFARGDGNLAGRASSVRLRNAGQDRCDPTGDAARASQERYAGHQLPRQMVVGAGRHDMDPATAVAFLEDVGQFDEVTLTHLLNGLEPSKIVSIVLTSPTGWRPNGRFDLASLTCS